MLIPSVMLLIALLVQPICLLYTRAVMHGAAAETARAVATARGAGDLEECKQYARRRLAAVHRDSVGLVLRVEVKQRMRPSWLEGNYGDWLKIWG